MSATNRGAIRNPRDLYRTPIHTIQAIVNEIPWRRVTRALEPAAGDKRIITVAKKAAPKVFWEFCEISAGRDFFKFAPSGAWKFDLILTNPPFILAQEFIERAFEQAHCVVMLQRLNFLGSQKRHRFWQNHPVDLLFPLSRRPDFTGEGGDATDYAWFVWDPKEHIFDRSSRRIKVIW